MDDRQSATCDETFYSIADAARLAGISVRTLRRWMKLGAVTPSREILTEGGQRVAEGFSLSDVGYIHLLKHLLQGGIAFERAVLTLYHFVRRFGGPSPKWRDAIVAFGGPTQGGVVAYAPDDWRATLAVPGTEGAGQRFFDVLSELLPEGVTLESLLIPEPFLGDVEISAAKADGLPVVRGTRVRTSDVRAVADLYGIEALTRDYYPHISPETARNVVEFERYLDKAA